MDVKKSTHKQIGKYLNALRKAKVIDVVALGPRPSHTVGQCLQTVVDAHSLDTRASSQAAATSPCGLRRRRA